MLNKYLPYLSLVLALMGGALAWGQNEQRITALEQNAPKWTDLQVQQARMEERIKRVDSGQERIQKMLEILIIETRQINKSRTPSAPTETPTR